MICIQIANPKDTIRIKYDTVENTKKTIKKLERLRKSGKYTHARIVQSTSSECNDTKIACYLQEHW